MVKKAIQIDAKDNVATTTGEINKDEQVEVINPDGKIILSLKVSELIPNGHKLAIKPIYIRDNIVKYGEVIGIATQPIKVGEWVNIHNVGSARMPTKGKEEGIL